MGTWIDFKELRSQLRFADVLRHYNVELKVKGDRASGFCPLPGHQSKREGKRRSPSFSAHLSRGIFHCFSCHGRGNILDFACLMDGLNPEIPRDIRETAIKLRNKFGHSEPTSQPEKPTLPKKAVSKPATPAERTLVNAPLDFELKHLDALHPYLSERGFAPETIKTFGIGFCHKGMMKDRIAIPLHDPGGQLIGYAGRLVNDGQISDESPRYLFPGTRERDGVVYEFHKSGFLYGGHRIVKPVDSLNIVEGFTSVWWLFQCDFPCTVGLMGSDCSEQQGALIVGMTEPDAIVTILIDGDEAGIRCAHSIFAEVAPHRTVRWVQLKTGMQPTDYDHEELERLLESPGAEKSGRSESPQVAQPSSKCNQRAQNRRPPGRRS